MNNEIKEILDRLRSKKEKYEMCIRTDISFSDDSYEAFMLLDYITNLQQENERLKYQLKLQKELTIKNRMRKHIYKSRCEKAIEYIKVRKEEYDNASTTRSGINFWHYNKLINDLFNILEVK